ncbi:hypothetical protein QBC41DRAFT_301028 [Cercophora samala]|uniref:Uncharacterized protein n=1 Tax=Cercophora samala TaxID=330535 RepID=A0AA39ZH91_9PEZI|nr:hypothetical protein QBC41DRAFT_301028 [Cercophora samala]
MDPDDDEEYIVGKKAGMDTEMTDADKRSSVEQYLEAYKEVLKVAQKEWDVWVYGSGTPTQSKSPTASPTCEGVQGSMEQLVKV